MKKVEVVVSRYKEDVSWVNSLPDSFFKVIYDKGNPVAENHLPNIPVFPYQEFRGVYHAKTPTGRESHTYLYHIIKNYDFLKDILFFLQGNPFDHCRNVIEKLQAFEDEVDSFASYFPLSDSIAFLKKNGEPHHIGLPLEKVYQRLFKGAFPSYTNFYLGGMFCVSRELIHCRPRSFYEEAMQIIYEEPLAGYVYERLWMKIFNGDRKLNHASYPKYETKKWELPNLV